MHLPGFKGGAWRFARGAIVAFLLLTAGAGFPASAADGLWRSVGCWFWTADEFEPEGYKPFLDHHAKHAAFELLTTSIRHPVEVTDPAVHDQLAAATHYARERGIGIALDLDVRLARAAFQAKYPDEMQEIVRLRTAPLAGAGEARVRIESLSFGDHYTFRARPYDCIGSRLLRVYSYVEAAGQHPPNPPSKGGSPSPPLKGAGGMFLDPNTIADITSRCRIEEATTDALAVSIRCSPEDDGRVACVMAAFTVFTPAVFAPHLIPFERAVMEQYADVPLAGVCKDEWGFPGRFELSPDDLWFSTFMADAYAARRPGHDLVADMLLMAKGAAGRDGGRAAAINHYMEMLRERNVAVETAFYRNVKEIFGADAYVGTHPTWYPYPGKQEAFKNGLNWWAVPRDIAQTDETTPYSARTALAKKWNSPLWLNMYYAPDIESYGDDVWRHVLGGGRMNFHPVYPSEPGQGRWFLDTPALRADARIRLLELIATAPIDCPVAVLFGHPSYLNWSHDGFADAGVALADALWEKGIYADLIPTSEMPNDEDGNFRVASFKPALGLEPGSTDPGAAGLRIAADGSMAYGPQPYAAAVLYHPEFERPELAAFMREVATRGKTALFRVGAWTTTFNGEPFDGAAALPSDMPLLDVPACVAAIESLLNDAGVPPQTPCVNRSLHGFPESMVPQRKGMSRLLDGTVVIVAGEADPAGDPILETLTVRGHDVTIDAVGIAAVRLDDDGEVQALACGGLKRFAAGAFELVLDERRDVALWRTSDGAWNGAVAGIEGPLPAALTAFTEHWQHLRVPKE